jgi:hypothetical protein
MSSCIYENVLGYYYTGSLRNIYKKKFDAEIDRIVKEACYLFEPMLKINYPDRTFYFVDSKNFRGIDIYNNNYTVTPFQQQEIIIRHVMEKLRLLFPTYEVTSDILHSYITIHW